MALKHAFPNSTRNLHKDIDWRLFLLQTTCLEDALLGVSFGGDGGNCSCKNSGDEGMGEAETT